MEISRTKRAISSSMPSENRSQPWHRTPLRAAGWSPHIYAPITQGDWFFADLAWKRLLLAEKMTFLYRVIQRLFLNDPEKIIKQPQGRKLAVVDEGESSFQDSVGCNRLPLAGKFPRAVSLTMKKCRSLI